MQSVQIVFWREREIVYIWKNDGFGNRASTEWLSVCLLPTAVVNRILTATDRFLSPKILND